MVGEKERVDGYIATIERMEPDINPVDASAFYALAAISLKRIADAAEKLTKCFSPLGPVYLRSGRFDVSQLRQISEAVGRPVIVDGKEF